MKKVLVVSLLTVLMVSPGCRRKIEWPPPIGQSQGKAWFEHTIKDLPSSERSAKFGGWGSVRAGDDRGIYSSGPCLVEGEILIGENIFMLEKVPYLSAENFFVVVDYGKDYTLIRLEEKAGHRLCLAEGGINVGGIQLESTASLPGSRVVVGNRVYEHRRDGWYSGGQLVRAVESVPLKD